MDNLYTLILAGGSGTRLWPWSREELPKQFLPLAGEESLFQQTVKRLAKITEPSNLYIVASDQCSALLRHQMKMVVKFDHDPIIREPRAKNTCPAIALGTAFLLKNGASPEDLIFVSPSDHIVKDDDTFKEAINLGREAAGQGHIVVFGVKPTRPDTGFGYIEIDEEQSKDLSYKILSKFVEKPDEEKAKAYLESGNYLWNGGFFLFQAKRMLEALKNDIPQIGVPAAEGYDSLISRFEDLPSISIDYAVMEKESDVAVVPLDCGWSDIGSWDALYETMEKDEGGNVKKGDVHVVNGQNNLIYANGRLVVGLDINNLVIADTPDALLVAKRGSSQAVRDVVNLLKENGRREATEAPINARPWGTYQILHQGDRFKIKHIVINPSAKLSLQYHHHRTEHWIVVRGTALAVVNGKEIYVHEGESTFIPKSTPHRLVNPGKIPLEIIEVQNGEYVGEDDIVRIEDEYKRAE
ncbi:MAG: mannose-1-phosphate guanylyltransferase/mannose-6-phosphate isomerase [Acetomicrobium sp.]|nr:mannose-1-phosphate guanylyltransferase/mannose-6-phosphate isomerase [Acetomicrobium sp.]